MEFICCSAALNQPFNKNSPFRHFEKTCFEWLYNLFMKYVLVCSVNEFLCPCSIQCGLSFRFFLFDKIWMYWCHQNNENKEEEKKWTESRSKCMTLKYSSNMFTFECVIFYQEFTICLYYVFCLVFHLHFWVVLSVHIFGICFSLLKRLYSK